METLENKKKNWGKPEVRSLSVKRETLKSNAEWEGNDPGLGNRKVRVNPPPGS